MSVHASVFDQLATHTNARLDARLDVGRGRGAAIWTNEADRVRYDDTHLHTLSLYVVRGEESRRMDRGAIRGREGALSLMPQGSYSDWDIGGRFSFVHLYLADGRLRRFAEATLDRDPSTVALPDLTYYEDARLAAEMRTLARDCTADDAFAAEATIERICHRLLTGAAQGGRSARVVRGGLAPATSRRVVERMRAHLDETPSLDDLATLAGLSPFHFQRMFQATHGLSPHAWLEAVRIETAERMIRERVGLAQVAAACGFCHQSHFGRVFRKETGLTPAEWRRRAAG